MTGPVSMLRALLTDAVRAAVPDRVAVYATSVEGVAVFPAIVLGMPSWKPLNGCFGSWEFPLAVIVARPGTADSAMVEELDELWPVVLDALRELEGHGINDVTGAQFGMFNVQGTDYPAQVLTCSLTTT